MKTTLAYILILLSILLSKAQFDGTIPLSFDHSHYLVLEKRMMVIPLLMQTFLFMGLKYLPDENGLKKMGKIIFVLLSIGYLFLSFLFFMDNQYSDSKMCFLLFLIAVLFSMYCVPLALNIKKTIGLILRILGVMVFIYALLHFCTKIIGIEYVTNFQISFFIILCVIFLILWILAEKLNPIAAGLKRKIYFSMLAFAAIMFVWAKDITYQRDFIFHGQKLSYSHLLFNNNFKAVFNSNYSFIDNNEKRKRIAIDYYMNSQCEKFRVATSQNKDATQLKKMILEVLKNDSYYFELYKSATGLDSITIDKVVEHKNSIFDIMPYGDCGY